MPSLQNFNARTSNYTTWSIKLVVMMTDDSVLGTELEELVALKNAVEDFLPEFDVNHRNRSLEI